MSEGTHTRLRCTSSNLFSAAVFRSLLPTADEFLPLSDGEADLPFSSSSSIDFSSSFNRASSMLLSFSLSFAFDFDFDFFLEPMSTWLHYQYVVRSLLYNAPLGDTPLKLEGAAGAEVIIGHRRECWSCTR